MKYFLSLIITFLAQSAHATETTTVAFGSCLHQWKPQPIWNAINTLEPDLFLFIGDNVYADTKNETKMRRSYKQLGNQQGYQRLKTTCPVYATWDDHDYGENDAGADYPMRATSEKIFLDFFEVEKDAPVRSYPGVYSVHYLGETPNKLQVILLDTRYFRSPLKKARPTKECRRSNIAQNTDPGATILGEQQWQWLTEQLSEPADVRIIASSIQVIPDQHCFEKWSNFPNERDRLFETIKQSNASGIVFISGDRHIAEISQIDDVDIHYPLYEVTSSGMNSARRGKGEKNRYRINSENFRKNNFGVIEINWDAKPPSLHLQIRNTKGEIKQSHSIKLNELLAPES